MSPEFTPPPSTEKPFTTPESLQECVDLYHKINSQIMEWYGSAISNHPVVQLYTMAGIINRDCAVDEEGNPLRDPTRITTDREERMQQQAHQERMRRIAPYANNPAIDTVHLTNPAADEYFARIESFASPSSATYDEFEEAYKKLTRIVKVREALAEYTNYTPYNNETYELVRTIATRLVKDVNQG